MSVEFWCIMMSWMFVGMLILACWLTKKLREEREKRWKTKKNLAKYCVSANLPTDQQMAILDCVVW